MKIIFEFDEDSSIPSIIEKEFPSVPEIGSTLNFNDTMHQREGGTGEPFLSDAFEEKLQEFIWIVKGVSYEERDNGDWQVVVDLKKYK